MACTCTLSDYVSFLVRDHDKVQPSNQQCANYCIATGEAQKRDFLLRSACSLGTLKRISLYLIKSLIFANTSCRSTMLIHVLALNPWGLGGWALVA